MPIWLTLGGLEGKPLPVVSSLTLTRNGNAITLSKRFYDQGIYTLSDFKNYLRRTPDQRHTLGMVHPSSMHNLLLRYWLAAGGIDPDRDVSIQTIPPAQMVADLKNGSIDGYSVGEPWNVRAAVEGIGFPVATDLEIWLGHPGKVLGVREDWATAYPNTHIALVKALLEACVYCADPNNAEEVLEILSWQEYAHHQFFGDSINRPSRTEHLWIMTQLARWGETPFPRNWVEILERICKVGVFSTAALLPPPSSLLKL